MPIRQDISKADGFFIGDDKTIEFEVFEDDGATPANVTGWALEWDVRATVAAAVALIAKASGTGIAVTGTYNAVRASNTQRVIVTVDSADTDALSPGRFAHALKRTDPGHETTLSLGDFMLQRAATR